MAITSKLILDALRLPGIITTHVVKISIITALTRNNGCTNLNRRDVFVSKKVKFEFFFTWSLFLQAKAMQNNFLVFEELVFFDLWIPDPGFWFPVPDSGFLVLGLP